MLHLLRCHVPGMMVHRGANPGRQHEGLELPCEIILMLSCNAWRATHPLAVHSMTGGTGWNVGARAIPEDLAPRVGHRSGARSRTGRLPAEIIRQRRRVLVADLGGVFSHHLIGVRSTACGIKKFPQPCDQVGAFLAVQTRHIGLLTVAALAVTSFADDDLRGCIARLRQAHAGRGA